MQKPKFFKFSFPSGDPKGIARCAYDKAAISIEKRKEIDGAAQRMMNRLLFGARAKLPEEVFSQCLDALEDVFREQSAAEASGSRS